MTPVLLQVPGPKAIGVHPHINSSLLHWNVTLLGTLAHGSQEPAPTLLTGTGNSEVKTESHRESKRWCCLENLLPLVAHGLVEFEER